MEALREPRQAGVALLMSAAVALIAVTMGSRSVLGLFLLPLDAATGIGIATVSFAVASSQLTMGLAQPFCGMLSERYGAARVIAAGTVLASLTGILLPHAQSAATLIGVFVVSGAAATVGSASLLIGTVSQRVRPERRGLVAGIVGAGAPLGQLVLAPATQAVITLAGWITAAYVLAGLSLAALPLALVFRRRPASSAGAVSERREIPLRESLANRQYWLINATFFICGLHVFFLVTHLPGVIEHCGLPANVPGIALAVLALFNIVGSISSGFAIQYVSMKRVLVALFAARGIGIMLFLAAPDTRLTVVLFAAWMGLTYMAVLPPTAGLIGRLCGTRRLATLLGISFVIHQIGAFVGAWLGGIVVEATGGYDAMWLLDMVLVTLAAAAILRVREQPDSTAARPTRAAAGYSKRTASGDAMTGHWPRATGAPSLKAT